MLETVLGIIFLVASAIIYIGLKASGEWWYGIQWGRMFYEFRRTICRLLLKLHK